MIKEELESTETVELKDISYGSDNQQIYDIYLPKNRTLNTKIMLLLHGGGWTSGDKSDMKGFEDFIIKEIPNAAVVNMNYRLADDNNSPYPMQIEDITLLVSELSTKRGDYQIGTELGVFGVSAGGHLGLLWSYAHDVNNQVNFTCSMVGPTNLLDEAYQNSQNPIIQGLIGLFGDNQNDLEVASPLFQVKRTSPPTLLFYGGLDPLIPISQGVDLTNKLTELNVQNEFYFYETEGHGWIGDSLFDTSIKLKAFIENNL